MAGVLLVCINKCLYVRYMHHACSYVRASARVCACVHARMCVCVCVCARARKCTCLYIRKGDRVCARMHACLLIHDCMYTYVHTSVRACLGVLACVKKTCFRTAISGRPVLHLFNFLNWYVHAFLIEPRPDCTFYDKHFSLVRLLTK